MLPLKEASSLAEHMAKKGLSGSIMMSKKEPMAEAKGEDEKSSHEADVRDLQPDHEDGLEACLSDLADAVASGDKESIIAGLKEMIDRIKGEDEEQDEE